MKLSIIKEVGYAPEAEAVQAINAAVDAVGDDLSPENIRAWIRMRYRDASNLFHAEVQRILNRESPSYEEAEEDPDDTDWDAHWAREDGDDERADDLEADAEFARMDSEECEQLEYEEYEEESVPETEIGGHKIKLLVVGRDRNPFGDNQIAGIEFDGKTYHVYKQGMINIWAFPRRTDMSNEEGQEFDKWMDDNYDKAPSE